MMDAAEIDQINKLVIDRMALDAAELRVALEQARKERNAAQDRANALDEHYKFQGQYVVEARAQRDAAQQDAKEARALLGEALPHCMSRALRARIEAMLEKKL